MKKTTLFFACVSFFLFRCGESVTNSAIISEPIICAQAGVSASSARIVLATYTSSSDDDAVIDIRTVPEAMRFDVTAFTVKAGQQVTINVINTDSQKHNFVLGKIGSLNKIGAAADALAMSNNGAEMEYIPTSSEIIKASSLLNAEEEFTITLTAPMVPGDYPYMCTFPGHWRIMNGMMKVVTE